MMGRHMHWPAGEGAGLSEGRRCHPLSILFWSFVSGHGHQ